MHRTFSGEIFLSFDVKRPINFAYEIEFVEEDGDVFHTMDGKKGVITFSYFLIMVRRMSLMARLKVGDVSGPPSDPIHITPGMPISLTDIL